MLGAVAPELMVTHVAAVIDALADPTQFSRLAAVGILQKMQGHGLLPQAVLREHDARLMRALQAEHCDDAVRDLVANEIMTVAFAPGSLGAVDASQHASGWSGRGDLDARSEAVFRSLRSPGFWRHGRVPNVLIDVVMECLF